MASKKPSVYETYQITNIIEQIAEEEGLKPEEVRAIVHSQWGKVKDVIISTKFPNADTWGRVHLLNMGVVKINIPMWNTTITKRIKRCNIDIKKLEYEKWRSEVDLLEF